MISNIVIVGGGPAGSSLAIRLVNGGFDVTLIERERFPRHKLCGEFISPECIAHFDELGVARRMLARGGDRITETRFYGRGGRSLVIPSEWFGSSGALGLSRAEMDQILLTQAKEAGATVLESTRAISLIHENDSIAGLVARAENGGTVGINADLIIDATGRPGVVRRLLEKRCPNPSATKRPSFLGFKAHLRDVDLERGRCEIYSFEGGYAGLSYVEDGVANFCFLIKASSAKKFGGRAESIFAGPILSNKRAAVTLRRALPEYEWLAVAFDRFGKKELAPAPNVLTVGDAAAFIDPFTGSGMLLAFESSEVLARSILKNRSDLKRLASDYNNWFDQKFLTRLRISSVIRNTAYLPRVATIVISLLGASRSARELLTRTTRQGFVPSKNKQ